MTAASPDVLTFAQVADRLQCSVRFIELEVKRRRLFPTRVGTRRRITPDELARYIAANTERGDGRGAVVTVRRKGGKLPPVPNYV
jgi:excisionase family DNA binding protein